MSHTLDLESSQKYHQNVLQKKTTYHASTHHINIMKLIIITKHIIYLTFTKHHMPNFHKAPHKVLFGNNSKQQDTKQTNKDKPEALSLTNDIQAY